MINLNCKMFEESKKSTSSEKNIINIIIFAVILVIIMIAESVIPTIMSFPELQKRIVESGASPNDTEKLMEISTEVSMMPEYLIPMLFSTVIGTFLAIIYCRFIEARHLSSMGLRKEKAAVHYLTGIAVGAAMISAAVLISAVLGITKISLCHNINLGLLALYFLGFLIQGMSEEVIFRGYFMNTLGARGKPLFAVLISASAFGLSHAANPGFGLVPMINLILFGSFMGIYMIAFDDIWGACAIHSIWNFMQGNFYGISVSGMSDTESVFRSVPISSSDLLTGGSFGMEGSIFTTIVLTAASIPIFIKLSKKHNEQA